MLVTGMDKNTFKKKVIEENKKIICFGASVIAQAFFFDFELEDSIKDIIDNFKANQYIKIGSENFKIAEPEILKDVDNSNTIILLAVSPGSTAIVCDQIASLCALDIYNIKDIENNSDFYTRKIITPTLLSIMHTEKNIEEEHTFIKKLKVDDYLIIPTFTYPLTTRCSLRCKNCGWFAPYVKKVHELPAEQVIEDIKLVLDNVDYCGNINLIGGEPFLYNDLEKVLEAVLKMNNYANISLVTNGTIIPNESLLALLKNDKIFVGVSDYSNVVNQDKFIKCLSAYGINYRTARSDVWGNPHSIKSAEHTYEELEKIYANCYATVSCQPMFDRKIYSCFKAYVLETLNFTAFDYDREKEYIRINESDDKTTIRNKIRDIFYNRKYSKACNYCGLPEIVPIAEQCTKEDYEEFYKESIFAVNIEN